MLVCLRNGCSTFFRLAVKVVVENDGDFVDVILLYVCLYARCVKGLSTILNSQDRRVHIAFFWSRMVVIEHDSESLGFFWSRMVVIEHDSESLGSIKRGKFLTGLVGECF